MRLILVIGLFYGLTVSAQAAPESKFLLIPLNPVEQTLSESMLLRLTKLDAEDTYRNLAAWDRMAELPPWVFAENKREIAYVFTKPMLNHAYRYAVIAGLKNQLIIVRAGGLEGRYEIFVRNKKARKTFVPISPPAA
jgi:hypothetical protein